ncbi:transmembrane protein 134 isoform X3 [Contarinia nasturtii]|uniref:transmembrane protein 134 isoform X3 n=1 Tax=Contarinia nasturtii TaxID=265458 RepID=UPI0012D3EBFD|nr:transmembrane protein 134 isoform X3 [Contarinia nasturtii]
MKQPRFSIHDAFEEENDEAIRVYGATVQSISNVPKPSSSGTGNSPTGYTSNNTTSNENNKFAAEDTTSRDSDSLIQEYINVPQTDLYTHCWNHPKIRENWRTVLAAVTLLIIGVVLVCLGIVSIANPANGSRGFVFLLAGSICFIPGAYHVVYIWLAAIGYRGYNFYHLPLFT